MSKIQSNKATLIRSEWELKLDKNPNLVCSHPNGWDKEYYFGTDTGDKVCPICREIK